MKLLKPAWVSHDELPIFSVDIHPDGSRFATGGQGGSSGRIIIWNMAPVYSEEVENDKNVPKLLCQMDNHLACVNCVRWSFSGKFLASGGDDKLVMIWKISKYQSGGGIFGSKSSHAETWRCNFTLNGHNGDVLDMAWSPHDAWLASCSVDNTVIVWNALKLPEMVAVLKDHKGLVKGVAWDPVGKYMASQSDDKTLRVWRTTDWQQDAVIQEPFEECGGTTHVLRLSWSPDGQYLVSAHAMNGGGPTAQIIEREGWKQDKDFVGHRKAVTCVRFNSNILQKIYRQSSKPQQYCCCAIGSRDCSLSVWLTALKRPLVVIHELFTSSVLDLSWSFTGLQLMACSWDGTVAFIEFSPEELGKPLSLEEKNFLHERIYGASLASVKREVSVVETPELIVVQEKKEPKVNPPTPIVERQSNSVSVERHSNSGSAHAQLLTPHKGPTNCQIETRTTDGKRRITPMFIPPPPDAGEGPVPFGAGNSQAPAFQSSSETRSSITIKRSNDVVDPNVSRTPQKAMNQDVVNAQPMSISPSSKRSSVDGDGEAQASIGGTQVTSKAGRKPEKYSSSYVSEKSEPQRIGVKRKLDKDLKSSSKIQSPKRARHLLDDKGLSQTSVNNIPDSPLPSSYPVLEDQQLKRFSLSPLNPGCNRLMARFVDDKCLCRLVVENNALTSHYGSVTRVCLYKGPEPAVSTSEDKKQKPHWETVLGSSACGCGGNQKFVAVMCCDASLHILRTDNGVRLLCPFVLPAPVSQFTVGSVHHVMALTVAGGLSVWEISEKAKCLIKNESLLPLMQAQTGTAVSVMSFIVNESGTPIITLSSGKAYMYSIDLSTWLQLGDIQDPVGRSVSLRNLPYPSVSELKDHPLTNLHSKIKSCLNTLTIRQPASSPQVGKMCSVAYIEQQLTACEALNSPKEYYSWLICLGKVLIQEGLEPRLRFLCNDLLGPGHRYGKLSKWEPTVMGHSKHGLLREILDIMSSNVSLQRLYSEFYEHLLAFQKGKSLPNGVPETSGEPEKL